MSSVEPLTIGLIGTGNRAQTVYKPLFEFLKPWVKLGAVCDPVKEHADEYAQEMGVPAFYSLEEMVASDSIEAALIVAPIDLHHAMSLYLSEHGIHNLVETSMCRLLIQAQEMVQTAADNEVVMRVAENFFRFPFDRIAKLIDENGFIGPIKRVSCFQDHTGYHNNSRWIAFYGAYPEAVQSIEHTMPTVPHYEMAHRYRTQEVYRARYYFFPDDRLVVDHSGNIKGMLGRYLRPGYTELNGARGTIARSATRNFFGEAEVRYCSDEALQERSVADEIFPIEHISEEGCWASERVDLPNGRLEYVNPYRVTSGPLVYSKRDYYGSAVMSHIVDFAEAIRGVKSSEYSGEDAMMAMMMEVACRESVLQEGARIAMPLTGDLVSEEKERSSLAVTTGVDPLDVDAMLAYSAPRP